MHNIRLPRVLLGLILFFGISHGMHHQESQKQETLDNGLLQAVRTGNKELITQLLESGAHVNAVGAGGESSIYFTSNPSIITMLLEAGADPNALIQSGPGLETRNTYLDTLVREYLYYSGPGTPDQEKFARDTKSGIEKLFRVITLFGGNVLSIVSQDFHVDAYGKLLDKVFPEKLLQAIILGDNENLKKALVQAGDVIVRDSAQVSALVYAAGRGNVYAVTLLLNNPVYAHDQASLEKAQEIVRNKLNNMDPSSSEYQRYQSIAQLLATYLSPVAVQQTHQSIPVNLNQELGEAIAKKEFITVKKLLQEGADINAPVGQWGQSPLHIAVVNGDTELVKLFLEYDAHVNYQDTQGMSALAWARDPEIAELLLRAGANPNLKTKAGNTVLDQFIVQLQELKQQAEEYIPHEKLKKKLNEVTKKILAYQELFRLVILHGGRTANPALQAAYHNVLLDLFPEPLLQAVVNGDSSQVRKLLQANPRKEVVKDSKNISALAYAAGQANTQIISLLLSNPAYAHDTDGIEQALAVLTARLQGLDVGSPGYQEYQKIFEELIAHLTYTVQSQLQEPELPASASQWSNVQEKLQKLLGKYSIYGLFSGSSK